jgi:hypothetical protein
MQTDEKTNTDASLRNTSLAVPLAISAFRSIEKSCQEDSS